MKRVALLVETGLNSGREIVDGIARYLHEHDDWTVFHHTGPLGATAPAALRQWKGDGIIARISDPAVLELIRAKGVPAVDTLGNVPQSPFPLVKADDRRIGEMVAEHLLEAGHRHFAFLGLVDERWSLERLESFGAAIRARARTFSTLLLSPADRTAGRFPRTLAKVTRFLAESATPLGLMVASDQFGPLAFEGCRRNHRAVPEEVAIVSVDNDLPFCNLCRPRLSSVEANHRAVGYEAARLLDALMDGRGPAPTVRHIPPVTLHRRPSSDATAVGDPALVRAFRVIRERACDGVGVDEVARAAGLSRSVLQRRFRAQVGCSVADSLRRVRLQRACDMLRFTDLPLLDVAERSGFNYQEYLTQVFRREMGITPARFRQQVRASGDDARPDAG